MNKTVHQRLVPLNKTVNKSVENFLEEYNSEFFSKLSHDNIKSLLNEICNEEVNNYISELMSLVEIEREKNRNNRTDESKKHNLKYLNSKRERLFKKLNHVEKTISKIESCMCNESLHKQMNIFYRNYDFEINNTKHRVII